MFDARRRWIAVLAGMALAVPGASAPAAPPAPTAQAACKSAVIVGESKCIAKGQYCQHTRRANRDYHRHGYHCGNRDSRGSYHLVYY